MLWDEEEVINWNNDMGSIWVVYRLDRWPKCFGILWDMVTVDDILSINEIFALTDISIVRRILKLI